MALGQMECVTPFRSCGFNFHKYAQQLGRGGKNKVILFFTLITLIVIFIVWYYHYCYHCITYDIF